MSDRLLTTREVADRLGFSPATVLRRWRCGELPGYRLGSNVLRFDPADVDAYLAERRAGPHVRVRVVVNEGPGDADNAPGRGHRRFELP